MVHPYEMLEIIVPSSFHWMVVIVPALMSKIPVIYQNATLVGG